MRVLTITRAALAAILLLQGSAFAAAQDRLDIGQAVKVREAIIACLARADFERFVRIAAAHDTAAFERLSTEQMLAGKCLYLTAALDLFVDDFAFGRVCLRPKGATQCAWTTRRAVRP